jgi:hypothetical protein
MRIRVSDQSAALDLSKFLRSRIGAIVEHADWERRGDGPAELEVSLLGSYGEEALRNEIASALRRWSMLEAHRNAVVELE